MAAFTITEYQVPGQYMREYPNGLLNESIPPILSVKRYRPRRNPKPKCGDATFILAGGIGFIKEVYEALIEDVDAQLATRNVQVRNYWIADMYCTGRSALLNRGNLGNAPSWYDHSRDLLSIVNHFHPEMQQPLFGIGHSMGAAQIANLALLHPRLFNSLILIESAIYAGLDRRMALTQSKGMAKRKEIINAPETLKARIDTLPFYQTWDPRARSALLEHGYVDARTSQPVNLNTHVPKLPIRTSTPRDSEVSLIYRPNFNFVGKDGPDKASIYERLAVPDANLAATNIYPFYRPENIGVYQRLEYIRASVFYIGGDASASSTPEIRKHRLEHTGIGPGGSGGHRHDRVKEMVVHGGGHQIAMDVHLPEVTKGIGGWVAEEMQLWRDLTRVVQSQGDERAKADPTMVASFLEWTADGRPIEEIVKSKL